MISEKLLKVLIVFFWISVVYLTLMFIFPFVILPMSDEFKSLNSNPFLISINLLLSMPFLFLFFYSVYFFYKYDKYSKSGVYFLFFHMLYSLIYFYKIIWKRKRALVNSYAQEVVLGNRIHIENEIIEDSF